MKAQEIFDTWRKMGALLLCRHDFRKSGLSFSAFFAPDMVSEAARGLFEAGWFLEDLSAMPVKEGLLVTYHYAAARQPGRLAVRALAERGRLTSIAGVYQGAEWHEREAADFFGLEFIGNPNPVPLLLPHDFPDPPPLLKAEKDLAAMRDLGLFGQAREILDPAWAARLGALEKGEGAA
ncbi:MAG: NADH-quinone oxidoreductase subunit C [Candidatus Adiutrix sp.]|jgi:NADH-quinone oxidoreductase subunit C|nr:NADH-quinone oxidoreductase subunit C [Candidatus Adiutrix sp.]